MIDLLEYAQLSITAGIAKRVKVRVRKRSKWTAAVTRHRQLKTQLATEIRKVLSQRDFATVLLGSSQCAEPTLEVARKLLHYDPSTFLTAAFPTRESLVYAVYEAHSKERDALPKLEGWYNQILNKK